MKTLNLSLPMTELVLKAVGSIGMDEMPNFFDTEKLKTVANAAGDLRIWNGVTRNIHGALSLVSLRICGELDLSTEEILKLRELANTSWEDLVNGKQKDF